MNHKEAQQRLMAPQYGLRGKPLVGHNSVLTGPDQVQERPHKKVPARSVSTASPGSPEAAQTPFWYPRDLDMPEKPIPAKPLQGANPLQGETHQERREPAKDVPVTIRKKRRIER
ncbi:hypothetical protein ACJU26_05415 [Acidithiobacillus sp. M4-SHS-6]|uniref:hypothetical protein n=1 Tax=Acidithiobacillus sp. M4-SHS-6 TaxID=3383024 RepID=UPI0039BE0761